MKLRNFPLLFYKRRCLRRFLFLCLCWILGGSVVSAESVRFETAPDGRTYSIVAPGLQIQNAEFAVSVSIDGKSQLLRSSQGQALGKQVLKHQATPYGRAEVVLSTIRFDEQGIDLLLRLEVIEGLPVVLINAGIQNRGSRPLFVDTLMPLSPKADIGNLLPEGEQQDWVLTGYDNARQTLLRPLIDGFESNGVGSMHEHFALYRKDGPGFFLGPVGGPVAYVDGVFIKHDSNSARFQTRSIMQCSLPGGGTRWGQQVGIFFEPASPAMRRWADWVAKTHGARLSLGAMSGWTAADGAIPSSGQTLLGVIDTVIGSGRSLHPKAILIDRVYQSKGGQPLETNDQYSEGLEFYARKIEGIPARPGLWLDVDARTRTLAENIRIVREAAGMGFGMLKLSASFSYDNSGNQTLTTFQQDRRYWQSLRGAGGESAYFLSIMVLKSRAAAGYVDANRSGLNAERGNVRASIEQCLWTLPMNRRLFAVDFDRCFLATEVKDVDPLVGGWPMARTWLSMVGLSCGNAFTSDRIDLPRFSPYLRNFEILTPPAAEETEVLDLGTSLEWPRLAGRVVRPWGNSVVALLWNPGTTERRVDLDLERVGGRPGAHYAVWSFWQNSYLGVVEHQYTSNFLAPGASEHLVFTEIPENATRPLLIGSNFHIYCGAAEIKQFSALESGMEIEFTDAGARSGSLFIYSKTQPVFSGASGCVVSAIGSAGENVWRIDIQERQFGEPQRVVFILPKPPYRYPWFWGLVGVLLCSVAFGGYKVVSLARARKAIENIQAREEERSRIARDLHDELGSSLAHIAMLGSRITGDQSPKDPSVLNKILESSKESLQRLDEIVWSVNPARDSTEHLASYLHKFTAGYLADSGIRLRTEIPEILPEYPLTSKERRALYLCTREAVCNALRHAQADTIFLLISVSNNELKVGIRDNGCGFSMDSSSVVGNGLANMRYRMDSVGGRFHLESQPGRGCLVEFLVSLKTKSKKS